MSSSKNLEYKKTAFLSKSNSSFIEEMYMKFIKILEQSLGKGIQTGEFGGDMKVSLINDGPTTIIIDSKDRE